MYLRGKLPRSVKQDIEIATNELLDDVKELREGVSQQQKSVGEAKAKEYNSIVERLDDLERNTKFKFLRLDEEISKKSEGFLKTSSDVLKSTEKSRMEFMTEVEQSRSTFTTCKTGFEVISAQEQKIAPKAIESKKEISKEPAKTSALKRAAKVGREAPLPTNPGSMLGQPTVMAQLAQAAAEKKAEMDARKEQAEVKKAKLPEQTQTAPSLKIGKR